MRNKSFTFTTCSTVTNRNNFNTRAKRRYLENQERGLTADLELIKKDIEQRDYQDMNRDISPLKQAEDAIVLDTSAMTLQEVVDAVLKLVEEKIKEV